MNTIFRAFITTSFIYSSVLIVSLMIKDWYEENHGIEDDRKITYLVTFFVSMASNIIMLFSFYFIIGFGGSMLTEDPKPKLY